jgi:hypothetical protein
MTALVSGYPWVLLLVGLIGVVMGVDRTVNAKKNESALLRILAVAGGVVMLALPGGGVAPLSLLLMLLLGLSLCARAMRRVPITFMIVAALGLGLLLVALRLSDVPIVGEVPIAIVVVVMLLILGGVFAASFAVESVLDTFLGILGWGPLVTVVGVLAAIQGLLIGAGITGVAGLADYF